MMIISEDQARMLLTTIKCLERVGSDNKPKEVTVYEYDNFFFTSLNIHGLKHLVRINKTVFEFNDPSILDASTDLISGVYEGGFNLWECTIDLLDYLISNNVIKPGQSVCDIGCGAGLLGIFSLKKRASLVHFLDYNKEVLQWFTLPNIMINNLIADADKQDELSKYIKNKLGFFAGDWIDVDHELNEGDFKYDVILTSETIYKKDNYSKLLKLMKNHLKPDGQILVAANVYYFGLNGGCFDFIEFVEKDATFDVDVVKTINDNLQRNILSMRFRT